MKHHKYIDMNIYLIDKGEVFLSLSLDIDIIVSILLKLVKALTNPTKRRMNPMDNCIVT